MEKASSNSQSSLGVKASPWGCTETGKISRSFYEKKKRYCINCIIKGVNEGSKAAALDAGQGRTEAGKVTGWQGGRGVHPGNSSYSSLSGMVQESLPHSSRMSSSHGCCLSTLVLWRRNLPMSTRFLQGGSRHQPVQCVVLKMGATEYSSQVEVCHDQMKFEGNCHTSYSCRLEKHRSTWKLLNVL